MRSGEAIGRDPRPLIAHVVFRFAVGGLENGVVNLVNRLPESRWRHAIVALTEVDPAFASRIDRDDVAFVELHKPPGHGIWQFPKLWRTFRQLRPSILHTRNLAALEAQLPAWAAGVSARVHGEHGWDIDDPDGSNRRHALTRRAYRPLVHRYVALSRDLSAYLQERIGIPGTAVRQIYNGVDVSRFAPAPGRQPIEGGPFNDPHLRVVGTVGRMQTVKAQPVLARAFVAAVAANQELRRTLRLVFVGEGALRAECESVLSDAGMVDLAWFAGERADIPSMMRGLDVFVLPSLAEGISNTILEAMASGLPVLATDVGGNADLVRDGVTGVIVPAGDVAALARALVAVSSERETARTMGCKGRKRVEQHFSLEAMVAAYDDLYSNLLSRRA